MNFSFLIVFIIYLSGASIVATELPLWRQRTNCVFCNPDPEIYMNAVSIIRLIFLNDFYNYKILYYYLFVRSYLFFIIL